MPLDRNKNKRATTATRTQRGYNNQQVWTELAATIKTPSQVLALTLFPLPNFRHRFFARWLQTEGSFLGVDLEFMG